MQETRWWVLPLCREAVCVFYSSGRKKVCATDSFISLHRMHFGEIVKCVENRLLTTQRGLQITCLVSNASLLLRHLIPGAQCHKKQPSFFVTPSSSIKSWHLLHLTKIRYNALLDKGWLSGRQVCTREKNPQSMPTFAKKGTLIFGQSTSAHLSRLERSSWRLFSRICRFHHVVRTSDLRNWDATYDVVSLHSVLQGKIDLPTFQTNWNWALSWLTRTVHGRWRTERR